MKIKTGALILLSFLFLSVTEYVYGEGVEGYAFTIEFMGFPTGAVPTGDPFVLSFSSESELVNKAFDRCGEYHGMYFIQPVYKMAAYSVVAQCFIRGKEV